MDPTDGCGWRRTNWELHSLTIGGQRQVADFDRIAKILRDSGYQGYLVLEYEEADDPYEAVPKLLDRLRGLCDA